MYAIRARRKTVTEKDFLDAVNKARGFLPRGSEQPRPCGACVYRPQGSVVQRRPLLHAVPALPYRTPPTHPPQES